MSDFRCIAALALALSACGSAEQSNISAPDNSAVVEAHTEPRPSPSPSKAEVPARDSTFTELDIAKCRLIEEEREEGPYWLRRCPGHAEWQLDWSESDLRQGLTLIAPGNGRKSELGLSELVAKGAFNSIAKTLEWRGDDAANPETLVLRMNVANGAEASRPDISRLVVVRLTQTPCLIGIVEPGSGQNEKARAIADDSHAKCITT